MCASLERPSPSCWMTRSMAGPSRVSSISAPTVVPASSKIGATRPRRRRPSLVAEGVAEEWLRLVHGARRQGLVERRPAEADRFAERRAAAIDEAELDRFGAGHRRLSLQREGELLQRPLGLPVDGAEAVDTADVDVRRQHPAAVRVDTADEAAHVATGGEARRVLAVALEHLADARRLQAQGVPELGLDPVVQPLVDDADREHARRGDRHQYGDQAEQDLGADSHRRVRPWLRAGAFGPSA